MPHVLAQDDFAQPVVYEVPTRPVVVVAAQQAYADDGAYASALRRAAALYPIDRSPPPSE